MDDGYCGDSNDGIMTRSAAYLFDAVARRNDGCKYSFRWEGARAARVCLGLLALGAHWWSVG